MHRRWDSLPKRRKGESIPLYHAVRLDACEGDEVSSNQERSACAGAGSNAQSRSRREIGVSFEGEPVITFPFRQMSELRLPAVESNSENCRPGTGVIIKDREIA